MGKSHLIIRTIAGALAVSLCLWLVSCGGASPAGSSHEDVLEHLFAMIKADDFDHIYTNDGQWALETQAIKRQPAFKQVRELASHKASAQKEYYTGNRYAELAAHALKGPKVEFLERRQENGVAVLYYRLHFLTPETSIRQGPKTFISKRVVRLTLDNFGRFLRFDVEPGYDTLWNVIPHRIEEVELRTLGDGELSVEVSCTGSGDIEGSVTLGDLTKSLVHMFHSEEMVWTAYFYRSELQEARISSAVAVTVNVQFADSAKDTIQFDVVIPRKYDWVTAVDSTHGQSAFEIKARQMSWPPASDTVIIFTRPR